MQELESTIRRGILSRCAPARYSAAMIAGVGIDVVDLPRFRAVLKRRGRRFLEKTFTAAERRYCAARPDGGASFAARFAAKEAVLKALGTGWSGGIRWTDVEVVRAAAGAVSVRLSGQAATGARRLGVKRVHL